MAAREFGNYIIRNTRGDRAGTDAGTAHPAGNEPIASLDPMNAKLVMTRCATSTAATVLPCCAISTPWMRRVPIADETIDYSPCAFMDTYDPATVFSSIDRFGRYAYVNQPSIAQ
jgi:hypothetical protein